MLDKANGKVRTNLGDTHQSFEERQKEAIKNKGTVIQGLNDKKIKVVNISRYEYKGTAIEAKNQAIRDAKKKFIDRNKGIPITLHYDNFGQKFDYIISGNSIDESMSSSSMNKSDNMGIHIAVLNHIDKVVNEKV